MYSNEEIAKGLSLTIDSGEVEQNNRVYLGMSQMGHSCSRYLWYYFHWAAKQSHSPRKLRIFSRGNNEEPRLIKILQDAGIEVYDTQGSMEDCEMHLRGHIDGKCIGIPEIEELECLAEFKTMNEKSWKKMSKNGVQHSNKVYYIQLIMYMHYQDLKKALFVAVNKNTEELYFELVDADPVIADKVQRRALDIINSPVPLPKAFDSPTYFECNWCEYKKVCWEDALYDKNCRTCKYSEPVEQGQWACSLMGIRSIQGQRDGCDSYDSIS